MSYFRGRPMHFDPDKEIIEQERQKWVYEQLTSINDLTLEMTRDPDREYRIHRQAFEETGDPLEFQLMLAYVRA
jgi:hypothetical protein